MDLNIPKATSERVILLDKIPRDLPVAGAKALTLGRLIQAGYPVPPGFCIILDAEAFTSPDHSEIREELQQAIRRAYQQLCQQCLPTGNVAVRSSAVWEDGSEQSFAGQFESILNVQNESELFRAIRSSWQSALQQYEKGMGGQAEPFVYALIVQEMVNPVLAGVVFSVHPVTGNPNQLIVEAVPGLGNELMSGQQEPTRLVFEKSSREMIDRRLTADFPEVGREENFWRPLLEMAVGIEELLDQAADIEFAYDGSRFRILQARPVTTAALSSAVNPERLLTRANIGEIMPEVVTPLTWSTFLRTLELEEDPARPVRPSRMAVLHHGLAHIDLQMLWDSYQALLGIPAEIILTRGIGCDLSEVKPQLREHHQRESFPAILLKNVYVWIGLLSPAWLERRLTRHFNEVNHSFQAWQGATSSQEEWLADGLQTLLRITARAFRVHQQTTFLGMCAYGALAARITHANRTTVLDELLAHHPHGAVERDHWESGIEELVDTIQQNRALKELFLENDLNQLEKKLSHTPAGRKFRRQLEEFIRAAGDRAFNEFELASPRWSEDPAMVLGIIRSLLLRRSEKNSRQKEHLSTKQSPGREQENATPITGWLNRRLFQAFILYRGWREKSKHLLMQCFGQLRWLYLQIARVLVQQHLLGTTEEIFFLQVTEVEQLLRGKIPWKLKDQVQHRMKRYQSLKAGQTGTTRSIPFSAADERLTGIPVSSGTITGPAKLMRAPGASLQPGEVIVTTATDPGWAPLFSICGGIVTEVGGMLSHTAILAREMHKPAVFSVPGITTKVRDGQLITVDGSRGEIVIHFEG